MTDRSRREPIRVASSTEDRVEPQAEPLHTSPDPATFYRLVVETASVGVWAMDADYRTTFVNRTMADLVGHDVEEMIGRPVADFTFADDLPAHHERMHRRQRGESERYERRFRHRDGTEVWTSVSATALRDAAGAFAGSFAVFTDITEHRRAIARVAASETRYRELVDHLHSGVAVYAPVDDGEDFVFCEFNRAAERIEGVPRESVIGRRLTEVFPGVRQMGLFAVLQRVCRTGMPEALPQVLYADERHAGWRENDVYRLPSGEVVAVYEDVTDEQRARLYREHSLALLQLLNQVGDVRDLMARVAGFLHTATGFEAIGVRLREGPDFPYFETRGFAADFVEAERRLCAYDEAGRVQCDASGHPVLECMCGHVLSGRFDASLPFFTPRGTFWTNGTSELRATSEDFERQSRARHRCLREGYESLALVPLRHGGEMLGLLQFTDRRPGRFSEDTLAFIEFVAEQVAISLAQRQSRDALRASEAAMRRLAEAVNQAAEAMLITSVDGTIEYVNPAFERTTGYAAAEILGRDPSVLKSGQQPPSFYRELWQTISRGETWTGRMVNRRKDGTLYTEDCTISPVLDAERRIERFVAVGRDVSREVVFEEQFRQTQRLESVGRLAAGVAHDLNNLLQPILGYAELALADASPGSAGHRGLIEILQAGERSRDLVRRLLAFGRKQTLEVKPTDVRSIVEGLAGLLRRTVRENIELNVSTWDHPCQALVDKGQIEQVVMNLVVNAQDAMPDGGILTIDVTCVDLDEAYCSRLTTLTPGRHVLLTVADTGHGMDEDTRQKMFEPFFTTKGELGTGLGLATVYGIVRQHLGQIVVFSERGKGTTIRVYLPSTAVFESGARGPGLEPHPSGTETVLVVEDDATVGALTCQILRRHGYTVLSADNGHRALSVAATYDGPIDLLLTDVVMPDMNGAQLCESLQLTRPSARVLFMSGYTEGEFGRHKVLRQGAELLAKPFSVRELMLAVRRALDRPV